MFKRQRRAKKVVETITVMHKGQPIPIYLLDDGTMVWRLSDAERI